MSLFICKICGLVENSNLVLDYNNFEKDLGYANMSLSKMMGDDIIRFYKPDTYVKEVNDKMMLCCKCNTGKHHDLFDKRLPTKLEKEYATYSEFNYITKYDHPISIELLKAIIDNNRYDYFKERIYYLKAESEYIGIHPLDIYYNDKYDEIYDRNSTTTHRHHRHHRHSSYYQHYGIDLESMVDNYFGNKNNNTKLEQPEVEKKYMLTKAKLKRLKRTKKRLLVCTVGNINIGAVNNEINDLENELKMLKG